MTCVHEEGWKEEELNLHEAASPFSLAHQPRFSFAYQIDMLSEKEGIGLAASKALT